MTKRDFLFFRHAMTARGGTAPKCTTLAPTMTRPLTPNASNDGRVISKLVNVTQLR